MGESRYIKIDPAAGTKSGGSLFRDPEREWPLDSEDSSPTALLSCIAPEF